jgi:hypothetical protein
MKYKDMIIVILVSIIISISVVRCNEREALDECVTEISKRCAGIFNYATQLENENARLNKLYEGCK